VNKNEEEYTMDLLLEREHAVLVSDGDDEYWLPKSQIEIKKISGESVIVTIPDWLAKDKGII